MTFSSNAARTAAYDAALAGIATATESVVDVMDLLEDVVESDRFAIVDPTPASGTRSIATGIL